MAAESSRHGQRPLEIDRAADAKLPSVVRDMVSGDSCTQTGRTSAATGETHPIHGDAVAQLEVLQDGLRQDRQVRADRRVTAQPLL